MFISVEIVKRRIKTLTLTIIALCIILMQVLSSCSHSWKSARVGTTTTTTTTTDSSGFVTTTSTEEGFEVKTSSNGKFTVTDGIVTGLKEGQYVVVTIVDSDGEYEYTIRQGVASQTITSAQGLMNQKDSERLKKALRELR